MKNKKIDIDKLNREIYLMTVEQPEILDSMLIDQGYDPKELEDKGFSRIKGLLFKYKVLMKKSQHENLYSKALSLFETTRETTKEGILALLRQRAPQLQFNNLEKMDEKDLRDILDESDLLDLMAKIERGEL